MIHLCKHSSTGIIPNSTSWTHTWLGVQAEGRMDPPGCVPIVGVGTSTVARRFGPGRGQFLSMTRRVPGSMAGAAFVSISNLSHSLRRASALTSWISLKRRLLLGRGELGPGVLVFCSTRTSSARSSGMLGRLPVILLGGSCDTSLSVPGRSPSRSLANLGGLYLTLIPWECDQGFLATLA